jgi:hypothetical protein
VAVQVYRGGDGGCHVEADLSGADDDGVEATAEGSSSLLT